MKPRASRFLAPIRLAFVLALAPSAAFAQGLREVPQNFRAILGGGGTLLQPTGEFHDNVNGGGGIDFFTVLNPVRSLPLGIRFDGTALVYGVEQFDVPTDPYLPRVQLEGRTINSIFGFGVGPQLTLGHGPMVPYAFATVGFAYFATQSDLHGINGGPSFAQTTNFHDVTHTASLGFGAMFRLTSRRHPLMLDLSAVSGQGDRAQYLVRGSIVDNPDGSVSFVPIESRTNNTQLRLGLAVGLR